MQTIEIHEDWSRVGISLSGVRGGHWVAIVTPTPERI